MEHESAFGVGLWLIALAVYAMPASGVLAAIATWAALWRSDRPRWPLVGVAAVILVAPYALGLSAGPTGVLAMLFFALEGRWGLLNPLVAVGAAMAVAARTGPRS
jgi:hypothetical protein